ncbi:inositol monophosphatase [Mycobacteroides abscessus subsp. massiliense]|nr:inositol monophosphatase [Mycobacteroides abscessus subsp. massiliense]
MGPFSREYAELCGGAMDATQAAVELLTSGPPNHVVLKGDRDVVTDVDIQIQAQITAVLAAATPEIGVLGEEDRAAAGDRAAEWIWVLDPIDGTSNFAHGLPLCAISLALVHCGKPVVGVIRAPMLDRTYYAVQGSGAWCNGRAIRAGSSTQLGQAIVSLGDYAVGTGARAQNRWRLALTASLAAHVERIRMFGSAALDLAFVAEGIIDACIIVGHKPWDAAAGVVIAAEAGARVTDSRGQPFQLDSTSTVAAASAMAQDLLTLIDGVDIEETLLSRVQTRGER